MRVSHKYTPLILAAAVSQVANSNEFALEEVIVTAEKREQSLQEVPSSVSAFGGDQLEDAGVQNIGQLQNSVPSLSIGGAGDSRPFMFIRGVGTRKFDIGTDGSVGVFVDEVYNARFSSSLMGVADMERVEVLKGPQGTLYGRNTIGGAINLHTRKPTDDFEGRVKVGIGNDGVRRVSGLISGEVVENLAGRLSLSTAEEDGVHEDTVTGKDDSQESNAARMTLVGTPSDQLEMIFTAQYTDFEQDARLGQPIASPTTGGIFGIVPTPAVIDSLASETADPRKNASDYLGFIDMDNTQASFKLNYDADQFTFTSITSYTDEELNEGLDFEGSEFDIMRTNVAQTSEQVSQEFRFTSTTGGWLTFDDKVNWVAGVYYFTDDAERTDNFGFGADAVPGLAPTTASRNENIYTVEIDTTAYAVFGQATIALTDDLNLTLGLRYSNDEKDYSYSLDTNQPGQPTVFGPDSISETLDFESTDPKVTLDYHLTEDVMLYATYSTGYKSGGVAFANAVIPLVEGGFDKEELETTEIGIKSRLFDDRLQLNASVYRYDYTDQQVQSTASVDPDGPGPAAPILVGITENAGESQMDGVEIEVVAMLTENLALNASYSWQDAEFEKFETAVSDNSGNKMEFAPENAFTLGLDYSVPVSMGELTLRGDYSWKDDFYFDANNSEVGYEDDFAVVNLAAIWRVDESLTLRLFCDNCDDEEYRTQVKVLPEAQGGGGLAYWAKPRRFGLEVTYDF